METLKRKSGVRYREKIYGLDGRVIHSPIFERKADARDWKARVKADRDRNRALGIKPRQEIGFGEFLNLWWERKQGEWTESTRVRYEGLLRIYVRPRLASSVLHEITKERVIDLVAKLQLEGITDSTVDRVVSLLRAVFTSAVAWDRIEKNPAAGLAKREKGSSNNNWWDDVLADCFLERAKNDPRYPVYLAALETGLRRSELSGLRWSAVSFTTNQIEVRWTRDRYGDREKTKTGVERYVPISSKCRELLIGLWRERKSDYVFCDSNGLPLDLHHACRVFQSAQKRARMEKVITFHGLRHSFASISLMRGMSIHALAVIMGHTTTEMSERYGHIARAFVEKEMAKMCRNRQLRAVDSPDLAHGPVDNQNSSYNFNAL